MTLIENQDTKDLYNVNLLQAMNWINTNWEDINQKIIYNCWKKTGLINSITSVKGLEDEEENVDSPDLYGENDCVGFISDQGLVQLGLDKY